MAIYTATLDTVLTPYQFYSSPNPPNTPPPVLEIFASPTERLAIRSIEMFATNTASSARYIPLSFALADSQGGQPLFQCYFTPEELYKAESYSYLAHGWAGNIPIVSPPYNRTDTSNYNSVNCGQRIFFPHGFILLPGQSGVLFLAQGVNNGGGGPTGFIVEVEI